MPTVKERMKEVIQSQPDDASYEEIFRELAFERMVDRGLADFREGRVLSSDDLERRIRTWQK
jgi:predicted transcriptional regulator